MVPNIPPDNSIIFFPPLRPRDPRAAVLLHAAVPEQLGGARESLRGAPAGPGHVPDAPPPQPAPLGCLPGLREAAAAGPYSSYRSLLSICMTGDEKRKVSFQNETSTASKNSDSSCDRETNRNFLSLLTTKQYFICKQFSRNVGQIT